MRSNWWICLCLCAGLLAGCAGYQLGPTGGQTAGARSIQINPMDNRTLEPRLGEAVTAAVIARPGTEVTEAELIEFCRGRLPGFKAPKRIHFRKSLPISAANKILKRDLKTEYASADKGG